MGLSVYIAEGEHGNQLLFLRSIESTSAIELFWVLVCAEQHVPPCYVPIVVLMALVLVVDAMHFWSLKKITHPVRRLDIRVVEELSHCAAEGKYGSALKTKPQQAIDKQTANDRICNHFQGMFVKGSDHFDTLGAVMDLVEAQPEEVNSMTPPVPPIEDERANKVGQTTPSPRCHPSLQVKQRPSREPSLPRNARQQNYSKLERIDEDNAIRPRPHGREFPTRNQSFQDQATPSEPEDIREHTVFYDAIHSFVPIQISQKRGALSSEIRRSVTVRVFIWKYRVNRGREPVSINATSMRRS